MQVGFGSRRTGLELVGVHHRQQLAGFYHITFTHLEGFKAPGYAGGDIHFGGFNTAVAGSNVLGEFVAVRHQVPDSSRYHSHNQQCQQEFGGSFGAFTGHMSSLIR